MGIKYTDFPKIKNILIEARQILIDEGIKIDSQSVYHQAYDNAQKVFESWQAKCVPEDLNEQEAVSDLANLFVLSDLIVTAKGTPQEQIIFPKLRNIVKGDPRLLQQGDRSQQRDTVFELLVAKTCNRLGENVALKEPDVTCLFDGHKWGIACKTANGISDTVSKAIRTGEKQIEREAKKGNIEYGVVAVNITNVFPHSQMYKQDPNTGDIYSLHEQEHQIELFRSLLKKTAKVFEQAFYANLQQYPRSHHYSVRGVLFCAHTVGFFRQRRLIQGGCYFCPISRIEGNPEPMFVKAFNDSWQKL